MESFIKKILKAFSLMILVIPLTDCSRRNFYAPEFDAADFSSIEFSKKNLLYAEQFTIEHSAQYSIVKINGEKPVLVVKEGAPLPAHVPAEFNVVKKPLEKTYLVSSSVMDFLIKLNAIDRIKFSGTKKENWFLPEAVQAMEDGKITYAGKYSAPDYEILYSSGTDISIQNTMIYHKPEVKEKLEQLGIPVIVEKSSYEKNPLGKLEWIKLYGLLFDKEKEADDFFSLKMNEFSTFENLKNTEKKTAFFYITSNGAVNVRKPGDYIPKMIEMAGGKYFIDASELEEDNAFSSMNMQAEDFYIKAKDADILIYNSTIDGMITEKKILLKKYPLLKDFPAFESGKIYCTDKKLFQETSGTVDFMQDLNKILNDEETDFHYLVKIK